MNAGVLTSIRSDSGAMNAVLAANMGGKAPDVLDGRPATRWRPRIIVADVSKPCRCIALDALLRLRAAGKLFFFDELHGRPSLDGLGDCHDLANALMSDLI